MSDNDSIRGQAVVVQPGEAPSYWQPVPANGHADPTLYPARTGFGALSMGYQTIAPGGRVREHSHGDQVELQICFRGQGHVVVDGVAHLLVPGTACLLGYDVKHEIVNDGGEELVMLWVITPPGLEDFFAAIGRPRTAGEPAPAPFARPQDVTAIERALGMESSQGAATAATGVVPTQDTAPAPPPCREEAH
jgi:quercetin dioxygenase-like cupin family protein